MGIKLGLENIVKGEMKGVQLGFKNSADRLTGVQLGGWNENNTGIYRTTDKGLQISYFINGSNILYGAQLGVMFNICEELKGLQAALFNVVDDHRGKAKGVQFGGLNISDNMEGVQIGLENTCSGYFKGVQIGALICEAEEGHYLQIGLWNRKKGDPWYKGVPFLRYYKEG